MSPMFIYLEDKNCDYQKPFQNIPKKIPNNIKKATNKIITAWSSSITDPMFKNKTLLYI